MPSWRSENLSFEMANQGTVIVPPGRYVLLGHQIHAIMQGTDDAKVREAVQR